MSTLAVGRIRYGLMLGLDGMVMDDGVAMRLADDHFLVTTTTGGVVVRRMVRVSPSSSSTVSVCSETWTVMMWPACTRPSATFWRQTVILPVALTRR